MILDFEDQPSSGYPDSGEDQHPRRKAVIISPVVGYSATGNPSQHHHLLEKDGIIVNSSGFDRIHPHSSNHDIYKKSYERFQRINVLRTESRSNRRVPMDPIVMTKDTLLKIFTNEENTRTLEDDISSHPHPIFIRIVLHELIRRSIVMATIQTQTYVQRHHFPLLIQNVNVRVQECRKLFQGYDNAPSPAAVIGSSRGGGGSSISSHSGSSSPGLPDLQIIRAAVNETESAMVAVRKLYFACETILSGLSDSVSQRCYSVDAILENIKGRIQSVFDTLQHGGDDDTATTESVDEFEQLIFPYLTDIKEKLQQDVAKITQYFNNVVNETIRGSRDIGGSIITSSSSSSSSRSRSSSSSSSSLYTAVDIESLQQLAVASLLDRYLPEATSGIYPSQVMMSIFQTIVPSEEDPERDQLDHLSTNLLTPETVKVLDSMLSTSSSPNTTTTAAAVTASSAVMLHHKSLQSASLGDLASSVVNQALDNYGVSSPPSRGGGAADHVSSSQQPYQSPISAALPMYSRLVYLRADTDYATKADSTLACRAIEAAGESVQNLCQQHKNGIHLHRLRPFFLSYSKFTQETAASTTTKNTPATSAPLETSTATTRGGGRGGRGGGRGGGGGRTGAVASATASGSGGNAETPEIQNNMSVQQQLFSGIMKDICISSGVNGETSGPDAAAVALTNLMDEEKSFYTSHDPRHLLVTLMPLIHHNRFHIGTSSWIDIGKAIRGLYPVDGSLAGTNRDIGMALWMEYTAQKLLMAHIRRFLVNGSGNNTRGQHRRIRKVHSEALDQVSDRILGNWLFLVNGEGRKTIVVRDSQLGSDDARGGGGGSRSATSSFIAVPNSTSSSWKADHKSMKSNHDPQHFLYSADASAGTESAGDITHDEDHHSHLFSEMFGRPNISDTSSSSAAVHAVSGSVLMARTFPLIFYQLNNAAIVDCAIPPASGDTFATTTTMFTKYVTDFQNTLKGACSELLEAWKKNQEHQDPSSVVIGTARGIGETLTTSRADRPTTNTTSTTHRKSSSRRPRRGASRSDDEDDHGGGGGGGRRTSSRRHLLTGSGDGGARRPRRGGASLSADEGGPLTLMRGNRGGGGGRGGTEEDPSVLQAIQEEVSNVMNRRHNHAVHTLAKETAEKGTTPEDFDWNTTGRRKCSEKFVESMVNMTLWDEYVFYQAKRRERMASGEFADFFTTMMVTPLSRRDAADDREEIGTASGASWIPDTLIGSKRRHHDRCALDDDRSSCTEISDNDVAGLPPSSAATDSIWLETFDMEKFLTTLSYLTNQQKIDTLIGEVIDSIIKHDLYDVCRNAWMSIEDDQRITVRTIGALALEDSPTEYANWHERWVIGALFEAVRAKENREALVGVFAARLLWQRYLITPVESSSGGGAVWYTMPPQTNSLQRTSGTTVVQTDINQIVGKVIENAIEKTNEESQRAERARGRLSACHPTSIASRVAPAFSCVQGITVDLNRGLREIQKMIGIGGRGRPALLTSIQASGLLTSTQLETWKNRCPTTMAFPNGVIDLGGKNAVFRRGRMEDYITMCAGVNMPYGGRILPPRGAGTRLDPSGGSMRHSRNHPEQRELDTYLNQLFHYPEVIRYMDHKLALAQYGRNLKKAMMIFTGFWNNSKSMFTKLNECAYGEYAVQMPVEAFAARGGVSNTSNANPEMAQAYGGARMAFMAEPANEMVFDSGSIKKLTGGDRFYARRLHENGGSFEPMFTPFLGCNKIPRFNNVDEATRNRIHIIPFLSTWCNNAPADPEEQKRIRRYPVDPYFDRRIPILARALVWRIFHAYDDAKAEPPDTPVPKVIRDYIDNYWNSVDPYLAFFTERIVAAEEDSVVTITEVNAAFRKWYLERNPEADQRSRGGGGGDGGGIPKFDQVRTHMLQPNLMGPFTNDRKSGKSSWSHFRIRSGDETDDVVAATLVSSSSSTSSSASSAASSAASVTSAANVDNTLGTVDTFPDFVDVDGNDDTTY